MGISETCVGAKLWSTWRFPPGEGAWGFLLFRNEQRKKCWGHMLYTLIYRSLLFEPAKRPDDRVDCCLYCGFPAQCMKHVLVFTVEWTRSRPMSEWRRFDPIRIPANWATWMCRFISLPTGKSSWTKRISNAGPLGPTTCALLFRHSGSSSSKPPIQIESNFVWTKFDSIR